MQHEFWNGIGGKIWVDIQEAMDQQLLPLGQAAMDALAPRSGGRLLDIGCGSGQTSLDLADAVGPGGSVVGLDISAPLIDLAKHRAAGRKNVAFEEGDAQRYAFTETMFDGVFSRFGVMFFDDPVAAFQNIRRALKPDGHLAFVCWRSYDENPTFKLPMTAASPFLKTPTDTPAPDAPGPFAFAESARVQSILSAAGFRQVKINPHDTLVCVGDVETTLDLCLQVGKLGPFLRDNPQLIDIVSPAVRDALAEHEEHGEVKLRASVWIIQAVS